MNAQQMADWLRGRGVMTIHVGTRVSLSLRLYNGDVVDTDPQEDIRVAFAQLQDRVHTRELAKLDV